MNMDIPIFDGHNDTLLRFYQERVNQLPEKSFFDDLADGGHINFPKAKAGNLAGGFFAVFAPNQILKPNKKMPFPGEGNKDIDGPYQYAMPLPPPIEQSAATEMCMSMTRLLYDWERESNGQMEIVRTAAQLKECLEKKVFAAILHFEGAEAIGSDLDALHVFYAAGLRSLGLVWSRSTIFGHGVPFQFPGVPDVGDGLTEAGKLLVRECNQLGILVDMSHLNEKGFWDVAKISDRPLVCTHSGAHAMCASPRNLLDAQLDEIKRTNGVTGINFHTGFLREDGRGYLPTSSVEIARHAAYVAERIGVEHVVLGSDFDGARMPYDVADASQLPNLIESLWSNGFSKDEIEQIAFKNWIRVLEATWPV